MYDVALWYSWNNHEVESVSSSSFKIHHKPSLNNQVPDALSRWIDEGRKENYLQEKIPILKAEKVLYLTRSQGRKEMQTDLTNICSEDTSIRSAMLWTYSG